MRSYVFLLSTALLISATTRAADVPAANRPDPAARPAAWGPADPATKLETGAILRPSPDARTVGRVLHFDLYFHNPTDRIVGITFSSERAVYTPPTVEDEAGRVIKVHAPPVRLLGTWPIMRQRLNPDASCYVASATLAFDPAFVPGGPADRGRLHCVAVAGPGKYKVTYPNAAPLTVEIH